MIKEKADICGLAMNKQMEVNESKESIFDKGTQSVVVFLFSRSMPRIDYIVLSSPYLPHIKPTLGQVLQAHI